MSLNRSYRHARTAKRRAAEQLRSEIVVWVLGAALLIILIGVVSQ